MRTSTRSTRQKPIILADCDGVLLNWTHHIPEFMTSLGMPTDHLDPVLVGNPMFGLDYIFPADSYEASKAIFEQYNSSEFLTRLPVFEEAALQVLPRLSRNFDITVITSVSADPRPAENRRKNLVDLYGDVFKDIICLEFGSDKTEVIREIARHQEVALWLDDQVPRVLDGVRAGVPSAQYTHKMVCGRNTGEVPEMPSWVDVESHLSRYWAPQTSHDEDVAPSF